MNYHIIAFSAVIYLHGEAGALQLVGRAVCAAGLTQTLQDVSPLANISLHPPPHTHTRTSCILPTFLSSFLFSVIFFLLSLHLLLVFIHSFIAGLFFFHFPLMLSFSPLYFPSSIFYLSSI